MASALLFLIVTFSAQLLGASASSLVNVKCEPAVGVIRETTKISCSFQTSYDVNHKPNINRVYIWKSGQEDPFVTLNVKDDQEMSKARIKPQSKNDPSLLFTNTALSDEGTYDYNVYTDRGITDKVSFQISVRAKYNKPTINSWPERIQEHSPADLYCNATGGYPEGTIKWFDKSNYEWTKNSELKTTVRDDKLFNLSSKLSFTSIQSDLAPFRCVLYNSRSSQEEESEPFELRGIESQVGEQDIPKTIQITAPIIVIGSLVVGLLAALLVFRRRNQRTPVNTQMEYTEPVVKKALVDPV